MEKLTKFPPKTQYKNCTTATTAKKPMKASRSIVRCGVDERYCCRTYWAISIALAFALSVAGPEERGLVVVGAGEDGAAACRFGAIAEGDRRVEAAEVALREVLRNWLRDVESL